MTTLYVLHPQAQTATLERFMRGNINALVATSVAEEGLDLPACQLVVQIWPLLDLRV